jgi:hypothetical protein
VGEQMADVGLAMQRAVDKTENMRARADAVSELEAAGTFDDVTQLGTGEDDIDRQLKQLSSQPAVDEDLAKLKAELGSGDAAAAPQIASGSAGGRAGRVQAMIVRIATEGQYGCRTRMSTASTTRQRGRRGVDAGDEERFHGLRALLELVRSTASRRDDELEESDIIVPPPD